MFSLIKLDEVGVTAVEYGLIACLVAIVVCAAAAAIAGGSLSNTFRVISESV